MASFLRFLNKPEYFRRPLVAVKRIARRFRPTNGLRVVSLPWGLPLEVETGEFLGGVISDCGIYDISVVEAIFRLTGPSDRVLDVGANIGYMSAAAVAAGAQEVTAFEPHPELFQRLKRNIDLWEQVQPGTKGSHQLARTSS